MEAFGGGIAECSCCERDTMPVFYGASVHKPLPFSLPGTLWLLSAIVFFVSSDTQVCLNWQNVSMCIVVDACICGSKSPSSWLFKHAHCFSSSSRACGFPIITCNVGYYRWKKVVVGNVLDVNHYAIVVNVEWNKLDC
jgi:hypothetical protein